MLCSCALALISITWLAAATSGPFPRKPVETGSDQRPRSLEIIDFCDGMCGTKGNKVSVTVDQSQRASCKVSTASHPLKKADEAVISTIDLPLDEKEFTELMKLTETTDFLSAAASYDSGANLVDSVYLTLIIYRSANREKTIMLKNYSSDDIASNRIIPSAIRRMIQIATGIRARAKRTPGTNTTNKDQSTSGSGLQFCNSPTPRPSPPAQTRH